MELSESALVNSPKCVIAIDPGKSGAVFKLGRGDFSGWRDFKSLDEIPQAVNNLCSRTPSIDYAVIEHVHAMPNQGVCSMFSFGEATGYAKASLCLCLAPGTPAEQVSPQKWQNDLKRAVNWGEKDFDSRALALSLFPSYADFFKRKKDHNSADAVLMAVWRILQIPQK